MDTKNPLSVAKRRQLTVKDAYAAALTHFDGGNHAEVEKLCAAIVQADPRHIDAINLMGIVAQRLGNHDHAIDWFQRAITLHDQSALLYYNLGTALQAAGRREEAVATLQKALGRDPDNPQIKSFLNAVLNGEAATGTSREEQEAQNAMQQGIAAHHRGELELAIKWYCKVVKLGFDQDTAYSNMGAAFQGLGRIDLAVENYKKAVAINPDHVNANYNLGHIMQELDALDSAAAYYRHAISCQPDYVQAHYNLGAILQKRGELKAAEECYRQAIAIKADYVDAHYNLATVLQAQGRIEEAISGYETVLAIDPKFAKAHNNLGNALLEMGRLSDAVARHRQAVALDAGYPEAHYNLGMSMLLLGEMPCGWREYEWRLQTKEYGKTRFEQKLWDSAADLSGKSVLLYHEQGYGDNM